MKMMMMMTTTTTMMMMMDDDAIPPYQRSLPGLLRDFAHRWPGVGRRASIKSGVLRPTHDRPGVNDGKTMG